MKSLISLFLLVALVASLSSAQNLWPLLQSPPVNFEAPGGLPPTDVRNSIKSTVITSIMAGEHPSTAIELKHVNISYKLYAGYRNIEAQDPVRNDTIFRIASMSKVVTAINVLQYVEKGIIDLEDPVSKYIQSFDDATVIQPLTPRVFPFSSIEAVQGSPIVTIPFPSLSLLVLADMWRNKTGIQLNAAVNGIRVNGIYTIMSFNPIARTVSVDLNCPSTVSAVYNVNGTLDVLPRLQIRWTPHEYVYVPTNPINPNEKTRVYYSTEPSKTVKIRHLLTNTLGLAYATPGWTADLTSLQTAIMLKKDPVLVRLALTPTLEMDAVEWAERIGKIPMMFQPGTQWTYGPQVGVAGAVLVANDRSDCCGDENANLFSIQKRLLFDPLNITDAGYFIQNDDPRRTEKIAKLAHVYTNLDSLIFGAPTVTAPYFSVVANAQDALLPGLNSVLMDGSNPSGEGMLNPHHPVYGSASPRKLEFGDAGLYMRTDEFQRIVTMLTQNGTYNGVQILLPASVKSMFSNQIGSIFVNHYAEPPNMVKWGYGVAVGNESVNPDPLVKTTAHWAGSFDSWWFSDQKTKTSFTLNSNSLPPLYRPFVNFVANVTANS